MEDSDQKDCASVDSEGSGIHYIMDVATLHAGATVVRDSETGVPTKIKIENTQLRYLEASKNYH